VSTDLDPARAEEDPAGAAMADLSQLQPNALGVRQAWEILVRVAAQPGGTVAVDFALEKGLIIPLDTGPRARPVAWVHPLYEVEMVWIPPGRTLLGADNREVVLPGFSLGRHPVTKGQFDAFLTLAGYWPGQGKVRDPLEAEFIDHVIWRDLSAEPDWANLPVTWVSYVDALAYCRWAGMTLPTEWQWEKAARGPDGRRFPWGDALPTPELANVQSAGTQPVGSRPRVRTAYGCEDMVGNVSEWCQMTPDGAMDFWPPPLANPEAVSLREPYPMAAVRGSCFLRRSPRRMDCSHRRRLAVIRRNRWVGFRPAFLYPWRPALHAGAGEGAG
jgi:serine/threonine-protein kinase